jgi:hypothetical protein
MTQLVLEGSGTDGCLRELNELVFLSYTSICVCTCHNVVIYVCTCHNVVIYVCTCHNVVIYVLDVTNLLHYIIKTWLRGYQLLGHPQDTRAIVILFVCARVA